MPTTKGAQFLLSLDLHKPTDLPAFDTPPPATDHSQLAGLRVLVVDDIGTNRLVAKAHLQLLGITTEEAASGEDALEKIKENPPDLVLLDMNMPGMDGTATLKQIRTLPSRAARLPVVAMTADATEAHRRRYLAAGLDDYMAKPLTPELVSSVLMRCLVASGRI